MAGRAVYVFADTAFGNEHRTQVNTWKYYVSCWQVLVCVVILYISLMYLEVSTPWAVSTLLHSSSSNRCREKTGFGCYCLPLCLQANILKGYLLFSFIFVKIFLSFSTCRNWSVFFAFRLSLSLNCAAPTTCSTFIPVQIPVLCLSTLSSMWWIMGTCTAHPNLSHRLRLQDRNCRYQVYDYIIAFANCDFLVV